MWERLGHVPAMLQKAGRGCRSYAPYCAFTILNDSSAVASARELERCGGEAKTLSVPSGDRPALEAGAQISPTYALSSIHANSVSLRNRTNQGSCRSFHSLKPLIAS